MKTQTATALAHPNIAFIKYWGNRDAFLRLPTNGSLSMNLEELHTRTTVDFNSAYSEDSLIINGKPVSGAVLERVQAFLDLVRKIAGQRIFAAVESDNNFPSGAGIASSASAFAALSLAATAALGIQLNEKELSSLARRGSGSACRSIPAGFVEWRAGDSDLNSYAFSIAPQDHWNLVDLVAIVNCEHKPVGSTEGHALADTSPLQIARVADAPRRIAICRQAILEKNFLGLTEIVELDNHMMHAVMMTSRPHLMYWQPGTIAIMQHVKKWREEGLLACYTIDAGPNVHVLCEEENAATVADLLKAIPSVTQVIITHPGGAAQLSG